MLSPDPGSQRLILSELWVYPLKSGRGISVPQAEITPMGLQYDRRWMLVDRQGRFLTQRELPQLAKMRVTLASDHLHCAFENQACLIPFLTHQDQPVELSVKVWRSEVKAWGHTPEIDQWFSECLGTPCHLVYMPDSTYRHTNPVYAPDGRVSFADGYPYLIANSASLERLNTQLAEAAQPTVTLERFRPNLVLRGAAPYAEDHWRTLRFEGPSTSYHFEIVKPCERCVIVNTHPQTGERSPEVLRTLGRDHRLEGKIIFGQNACCHQHQGILERGMRAYATVH